MVFESLAFRTRIELPDVPDRWVPLIHPYDPDLPLFPIYYFHCGIPPEPGRRPGRADRVFGYIERLSVSVDGQLECILVTNKDIDAPANSVFREEATAAMRERLGIADPVRKHDMSAAFASPSESANRLLEELWERVVVDAYGDQLPFGRFFDEVLGLARFVASFRSQSGRKGELIQTHYFASRFGERIQAAGGIPQLDFFLLPSIAELADPDNPLSSFPRFRDLVQASHAFCEQYGVIVKMNCASLLGFARQGSGQLSNAVFFGLVESLAAKFQEPLLEAFNAMGKGAHRTIILLLMLENVRTGRLRPGDLGPAEVGELYTGLPGSYLSPKVVSIYAQQCWANPHALPVDLWVEAFLKWPAKVWPRRKERGRERLETVLRRSKNLGKVERLVWVAAQARKVHSSACDDALWCIKKSSESGARGANPLSCGICAEQIRNVCPAYLAIAESDVTLNERSQSGFEIETTARNNSDAGQAFVRVSGVSIYNHVIDDFSPKDDPDGLNAFPDKVPHPTPISVAEFVSRYGR